MANYNISLPERVNSVKSMTLRSVELPISFYNISSQLQNNSFTVKNLLIEKTIVLDDNQYSESGTNPLGSAVETKLNASTLTWVQNLNVTYDTSTKKITIANTNAFNVDIIFDKANCDGGKGGLSPTESLMSKLGWILGFRLANYTIEAGSSITGEAIMDVHGPRYLYLIIDEFKNEKSIPFKFIIRPNSSTIRTFNLCKLTNSPYVLTSETKRVPNSTGLIEPYGYSLVSITIRPNIC